MSSCYKTTSVSRGNQSNLNQSWNFEKMKKESCLGVCLGRTKLFQTCSMTTMMRMHSKILVKALFYMSHSVYSYVAHLWHTTSQQKVLSTFQRVKFSGSGALFCRCIIYKTWFARTKMYVCVCETELLFEKCW